MNQFYFKVCERCPVKTPRDCLLLHVGSELYKVHPHPHELLPYLIKNNPLLPVVYNHRIKIDVNTAGQNPTVLNKYVNWCTADLIDLMCVCVNIIGREEWISTGLYLSPGMKTYMSIPAVIINKGWKVLYTTTSKHYICRSSYEELYKGAVNKLWWI